MALYPVDQFQFEGVYTIAYDSVKNKVVVTYQGSNRVNQVSEAERGHENFQQIAAYCIDTTKYTFFSITDAPFATFETEEDAPECVYVPPPPVCDIAINSIVTTPEQSTGANDGTATINASSSHPPILYSLDGNVWSASNVFANLLPSNYLAYAKDALNGCQTTKPFAIEAFVNPLQNFTSDLPVVQLPGGNISRWNAAFNPVVINYQRKDFAILTITKYGENQIAVTSATLLSAEQYSLAITDVMQLKTTKYDFRGKADSHQVISAKSTLFITTEYLGDDAGGFLNIPNTKQGYRIQTEITSGDNPVKKIVIVAEHSPDTSGATKADISAYLQTLLRPKESYDYLLANYRDYNLGGSYSIRYREVWNDGATAWFAAPYPLYFTYAAMQLGEEYGGNLAQYVPFNTVPSAKYRAKWLTGFESPTLWLGLPFEIAFIYSENILNQQLYLEVVPDIGVSTAGAFINPDASYVVNPDSSKLLIERVYNSAIEGYPIFEQLGVNRVKVPQNGLASATKATLNIYYINGDDKVYIMQPITLKVIKPCNDPYIYVKWINRLGAWDYWRFGYNQEYTPTSTNSQTITRYISDWVNDNTVDDYLSRQGDNKVTVVAGGIDKSDYNGLKWLIKSIKAQMLVSTNPVKWQTVIVPDSDFAPFNTRRPITDVKIELGLVPDNIQMQ